jgi:hypothetical protein
MRKFFICFVALLAIAAAATEPARAQSNTVTWTNYNMPEFDLSSQGDRQTTDDVTITSNGGSAGDNDGNIYFNGAFTFSVPVGSVLTQIVIRDDTWLGVDVNNTGWSVDEHQTQATWTGSARSVACQINASHVQYFEFTIASAVPKMYTSEVSITDLVPGDTLAEGATIIGSGDDDDMVYLNAGRAKANGVVQSYWTNLFLPPTVIGTNGTISGTYTPVDGNGQDGNAWVVTDAVLNDYDGFEVGLAGIIIPVLYTVTLADGGKDTQNWTITPAEATTTGVTEGQTVTVTYAGTKRVKSVKAVKKADNAYLKWNADQKKLVATDIPTTANKVQNADQNVEWAGTYVVEDDVTISGEIKLTGDVELIIKDGAKLTVTKIIHTQSGASLSVYGQTQMSGELNVTNQGTDAIFALYSLAVHSCKVRATSPAGDGGGVYNTTIVNVYGGSLDAEYTGEGSGHGIILRKGGALNIYGGEVKAVGKGNHADYSYGIKSSSTSEVANVKVYGGKLWAECADNKAFRQINLTTEAGFNGKIETSDNNTAWTEYTTTGTPTTKYVRVGY